MKIVLDVSQAKYKGTGVATYTNGLIRYLPQVSKHQYRFFNQRHLWPAGLLDLLFNRFHQIPIEAFVGQVDIFHASDWTQPPARHAKLITTIHDLTVIKYPQTHQPHTLSVHQRRLNWVKQEADAILADSQSTKQDIIDLLQVPAEKIHVVYLAAHESFTRFSQLDQETKNHQINLIRKKYHLDLEYLLAVGTQEPRKNLAQVIKAYQVIKSNSPLLLAIVGHFGWGEKINPVDGVNVLGFVSDEDLPALYAGARCLIYPSLYEGFGLPPLEAMTVGCPVVTSNRGSLKEVVGRAGVTINPEDTEDIVRGIGVALLNYQKMVRLGRQKAAQFSWEKAARETVQVYEQIANQ